MYKRRVIKTKLDEITKELEKAKNGNPHYNKGIDVAITKIKDLQKNLLYEHEKNPKSTLCLDESTG